MTSSSNVMMPGDLHTFFCVSKKNLKMFSCPSDGARLQYRMEHAENAAACASWSEEALPASHIGCSMSQVETSQVMKETKVPIWVQQKMIFVSPNLGKITWKVKTAKRNKLISDRKIFFGETSCHFRGTCYH